MKLLVLGGSNTVLKHGYYTTLIEILKEIHNFNITKAINLAVGGNTSAHGLEIIKRRSDVADFDIILIEYTINDWVLSTDDTFDVWAAAYEGLIRFARSCRPDVQIFSIILGRRDPEPVEREMRLVDGIEKISKYYGTHVINANLYLRAKVAEPSEILSFYEDSAHYKRRIVTSLIGNYVANGIVSALSHNRTYSDGLPPSLSRWHFEHSNIADLTKLLQTTGDELRIFSNSRFTQEAIRLRSGKTYTAELKGEIILLTFIVAPDSGTLMIEEEGKPPVALHTLHPSVLSGDFAFLIKSTVFKQTSAAHCEPRKVSFRVLSRKEYRERGRAIKMPAFNMISAPVENEDPSVYLSTALIHGMQYSH